MSLELLLLIVGAYLFGSIPTAYIAGKWLKGVDIRRYGSGNVGGSNVYRKVARWAVVPVGLFDVSKGAAPILVAQRLDYGLPEQVVVGLAAIIGHNWSLYLRFNGGRGIGTTLGVLLLLAPRELLAFASVALFGVVLRQVALAVGLAMTTVPVVSLGLGEPTAITLGGAGMVVLMVIKRLLANRAMIPGSGTRREILLNRLLLDRDIRSREAWIHRVPPGAASLPPPPEREEPFGPDS